MSITEYLADSGYLLNALLDEMGKTKATKGAITVSRDRDQPNWQVHVLAKQKRKVAQIAVFKNPDPAAFIAYLRALEQA
jgi:hypothetical protein